MNKNITIKIVCGVVASVTTLCPLSAQVQSASKTYVANKLTDRTLVFDTKAEGKKLPIKWGLDTAWPSDDNIRRGISFIGKGNISVARASFQPWLPLENGELPSSLLVNLNQRLKMIGRIGTNVEIVLNDDPGDGNPQTVHESYKGNPRAWADLIDATLKVIQEKGWTVTTVSPFNEPDYGWNQGTREDFYNIAKLLKEEYPRFEGIRISGGNTLNCDVALEWYNYLYDYIDEGNTHQLAGDFDHYADFFAKVRKDGKYATADELHNVMEAMVGVEYGMQTGIWWGTAELARGEFCKASFGERLAYSENRPAWSSAAVYRSPEGKIQAFCGTSERQAKVSNFRFVSKDRDVFFDGHGPQREFIVDLPGGNGYQQGQTNAECVVNVTWGEDVQPVINGTYKLMNGYSKKVLTATSLNAGAGISQKTSSDASTTQQWVVSPVSPTAVFGDFSYYTIRTASNEDMLLDVKDWSLETRGSLILWNGDVGANEQWYLTYDGDGYFHIVSRHSNLCLELAEAKRTDGVAIHQATRTSNARQKWRLIPVDAECETDAPESPSSLTAEGQSASVKLSWIASPSEDVTGYTVLRADAGTEDFNTVGRGIAGTSFIDNTVEQGKEYLYKVKAVDRSLNSSPMTDVVSAKTANQKAMIAQYQFEDELSDNTQNAFHASAPGNLNYVEGKSGEKAVVLNLSDSYMQLPYQLGNQKEMTVATWVYWRSVSAWQRIFDFGNGQDEYMFLTPSNGSKMRFVMKNGGDEQVLECDRLPSFAWTHVAVTVGEDRVALYLNGEKVAESDAANMSIRPSDFKPVLNYIGRSQYDADPLFKGYLDDFRVYNYALSPEEVAGVMDDTANAIEDLKSDATFSPVVATEYYTLSGLRLSQPQKGINIVRYVHENGSVTSEKVVY